MTDLLDTLRDIARTACEHDATLLGRIDGIGRDKGGHMYIIDYKMPCSATDGPRHPDEDAEYYADQEELDKRLEQERQQWWLQQDQDEEWHRDFAEYANPEER